MPADDTTKILSRSVTPNATEMLASHRCASPAAVLLPEHHPLESEDLLLLILQHAVPDFDYDTNVPAPDRSNLRLLHSTASRLLDGLGGGFNENRLDRFLAAEAAISDGVLVGEIGRGGGSNSAPCGAGGAGDASVPRKRPKKKPTSKLAALPLSGKSKRMQKSKSRLNPSVDYSKTPKAPKGTIKKSSLGARTPAGPNVSKMKVSQGSKMAKKPIEKFSSFGAAFRDARKRLGTGKFFTYKGKKYKDLEEKYRIEHIKRSDVESGETKSSVIYQELMDMFKEISIFIDLIAERLSELETD